ncbi:MAG: AGE family epimerase/isomerase [Candidatus Thorarchaeota archaeon]
MKMGIGMKVNESSHARRILGVSSMRGLRISNSKIARTVFVGLALLLLSSGVFFPNLLSANDSTNSVSASTISPNTYISLSSINVSDTWTYEEYVSAIDKLFNTFNYFNLSKYGGGWQYEVTRDWTDKAFTYGKYIWHDAHSIMGLLAAYNLTSNPKYLDYAEDIWNWDQVHFWDDVYGGYYVRLNQDNSIAIGDKGMNDHGLFGLATTELYAATGNISYLNCIADIYSFVTDHFYDPSDGSYFGSLTRSLAVSVDDIVTDWSAPYARFLTEFFRTTGNATIGDKARELIDNLIAYSYDPIYGWIVNRVSNDWSTFTDTRKGWYDHLQTFIDAYNVFGNISYLNFAQTCYNDIQQANSTAGYLMEMNQDWTSNINDELLGEKGPGVVIAYFRMYQELQNDSIGIEALRIKDAIYDGLHDPLYEGIYRRIYAGGSQSTWKQWCGAGRVMEMLAEFASNISNSSTPVINHPSDMIFEHGCQGQIITWTPSDSNPSNYSILVDDTTVEQDSWNGEQISYDVSYLTVGNYNVTLVVEDDFQNSTSDSVLVQVIPSIAPVIDPHSDFTIEAISGFHEIVWEPYDFMPSAYELQINGSTEVSGQWDNETLTAHVTGLDPGIYNYTMIVFDEAGNSASDTVIVTCLDTTDPIVSSPDDISFEAGDGGYFISWTTSDYYPDEYGVYRNGSQIETDVWLNGEILVSVETLEPGLYLYSIIVWDESGNFANDSLWVTVTDTTVPIVNEPIDVTIEAGTTGNSLIWITYELHPESYEIKRSGIIVSSGDWNQDAVQVAIDTSHVGGFHYVITLFDRYGNSISDTVLVLIVDTTAPTVNQPQDISYEYMDTGNNITWSINDLFPNYIEIYQNGTWIEDIDWNESAIDINIDGLEIGIYNFTIVVFDTSGNSISDSVLVTVTEQSPYIEFVIPLLLVGGSVAIIIIIGTCYTNRKRGI